MQNSFLNKEIEELNLLRQDDETKIKSLKMWVVSTDNYSPYLELVILFIINIERQSLYGMILKASKSQKMEAENCLKILFHLS